MKVLVLALCILGLEIYANQRRSRLEPIARLANMAKNIAGIDDISKAEAELQSNPALLRKRITQAAEDVTQLQKEVMSGNQEAQKKLIQARKYLTDLNAIADILDVNNVVIRL